MKVLILGATGPSGTQLVNYALKKNHDVTAFVRDPSKIKIQNPKLHVVTGDARNKEDLAKAMQGKDAVLSGLGVGKSLKSNGLIEATTDAIVKAMKETGVRRLIFISAFGVGKTFKQASIIQKLAYRIILRNIYPDKEAGDANIMGSGLDWVLVYPVALSNKPSTGNYIVGEKIEMKGFPMISRGDVADFMTDQIESNQWVGKQVIIAPRAV